MSCAALANASDSDIRDALEVSGLHDVTGREKTLMNKFAKCATAQSYQKGETSSKYLPLNGIYHEKSIKRLNNFTLNKTQGPRDMKKTF